MFSRLTTSVVIAIMGLSIASCTFLVDPNATQCRTDADCARFGARCNLRAGLCARPAAVVVMQPDAGADSGDATGPRDTSPDVPATWGYPPMCRTFDNRARLLNLGPDGGLKPLP